MKLDILVFAAHPDDAELGCSGTIMKHIAAGKKVGLVDLTEGQLGSQGTVETRYQEAAKASEIMGLHARENLQMEDGFFENNHAHRLKIIEMIRKYQPEVVFANAIRDRHPDHGRGAKVTSEACFYAGLKTLKTQHQGEEQIHWRPKAVYHYIQDYWIDPDFVVDVTPFWDRKMQSIMAYGTQFYNPDSKEPYTPISSPEFLDNLTGRAVQLGRYIGARYGEGFTVERPPGVEDVMDLI